MIDIRRSDAPLRGRAGDAGPPAPRQPTHQGSAVQPLARSPGPKPGSFRAAAWVQIPPGLETFASKSHLIARLKNPIMHKTAAPSWRKKKKKTNLKSDASERLQSLCQSVINRAIK